MAPFAELEGVRRISRVALSLLDLRNAFLRHEEGSHRDPNHRVNRLTRYAKSLHKSSIDPLGPLEPLRFPVYTAALVGGTLAALTLDGQRHDWRTAFLMGVVSGTFSTVVISFGAPLIGRSASVDWMELSPVWIGPREIRQEPAILGMVAGLMVHASADVAWATLLFGGCGERLLRGSPGWILLIMPSWAVVTSMIEYFAILPWLQPLVTRQVPYWTALAVHITSGSAYGLFPLLKWLSVGRPVPERQMQFAARTGLFMAASLLSLAAVYARQRDGRTPRWPMTDECGRSFGQDFLYQMTGHHVVGSRMAGMATEKVGNDELRLLARLEVAQQEADIQVMRTWWRSWVGGEIPGLSQDDYASMAGMPHPAAVEALAQLEGDGFEHHFLKLMIPHHHGAILMANDAVSRSGDPRLRTLADSIRHAQQSQIERMRSQPNAPESVIPAASLYIATAPH